MIREKLFLFYNIFAKFVSKSTYFNFYPLIKIHQLVYRLIKPKHVKIFGFKIFINTEDRVLSDALVKDRIWEPFETYYFQNNIGKSNIVFDIGANIGYNTLLFSRLVGSKGRVIAFEPDEDNFRILTKNVHVNNCKNVILVKKALTNKSGRIKLYLDEINKGDHHIYDAHDTRRSVPVEALSLDDYLHNNPYKIDFIKLDVQGAEGLVFAGMKNLLARNKKICIVCEFWPAGLANAGTNPREFLKQLTENKFKIFQLNEDTKKIEKPSMLKLINSCTIRNKKYANLLLTR